MPDPKPYPPLIIFALSNAFLFPYLEKQRYKFTKELLEKIDN